VTRAWLALLRALLNVNFGYSALKAQVRRRERLWELALIGAGIAVGVCIATWMVVQFASAFLDAGIQLGQPEFVLTIAHFSAAVMVLLFGLAYVMGAFYFSNDAGVLMAWPLSARQILSAKFATVLVNEYLTTLALLVPVYAVYAAQVPVSPLFFPAAALVFLLTPVVPLAVSALLVVLLMRVVSISRRRDFFTMLGSLAVIVGALVLQYFLQTQGPELGGESDAFELVFGRAYGLSKLAAAGYPPSYWSMLALAEAGTAAGLGALAGLFAVALAAVGVLLYAGERFFLQAAQVAGTATASASRARKASLEGGSAPVRSLARVERKLFLRTPMYVLNGFSAFVIVPVIALLPGFTNEASLASLLAAGARNPVVGLATIWGWFALAAGVSIIPSTAFSREGPRLWAVKSLPVSGRELFLGKLLAAQSMVLVGALPGAAALTYVLRLNPGLALVAVMLGAVTSTLVAMGCLLLDMARPWLTWTDPTRAVKSNVNGILGSVGVLVLVAGSAWVGALLARRGIPPAGVVALFAALHVVALFGLWQWIKPRLDPLLQRMGD